MDACYEGGGNIVAVRKIDFVVHYGWQGYEDVILEKSLIGSYTIFEVK